MILFVESNRPYKTFYGTENPSDFINIFHVTQSLENKFRSEIEFFVRPGKNVFKFFSFHI